MRLPNGERAVVDIQKLREYCLSLGHPRGRNKARVFAAALGLTADDAATLRVALLEAARTEEAHPGHLDGYGRRYVVDFSMEGPRGVVRVRSAWIIRTDEDFPRLTTCHVV